VAIYTAKLGHTLGLKVKVYKTTQTLHEYADAQEVTDAFTWGAGTPTTCRIEAKPAPASSTAKRTPRRMYGTMARRSAR